jgi:hypothetical protein
MHTTLRALDTDGYAVAPNLVAPRETAAVARVLRRVQLRGAGTRNLLRQPWCRALVQRIRARLVNLNVLAASSVAVQCTLFDKTPERNWLVAFHQDLSIPVRARVHSARLGAWSEKEGEHFVQVPPEILESLLAVRVHIDDCDLENGPIRFVAGSHRRGRLSTIAARELRATVGEEACPAKNGDAILMRPLTLHASSKASAPRQRRVLHILFGPPSLPYELDWKHVV